MRRLVLHLLMLLFFPVFLSAQEGGKQYNSLLWRISGNGLSKPSYLYGTMHLTDKRLFYFGDSLYRALEQTDGFAAELDMSTLANDYINMMLNEEDEKSVTINNILTEEELEKYKDKLEKKIGKKINKITTRDIEAEERRQTGYILRRGEMKTFMDAYLFDLASKQGKWTGGIEDLEDQVGLHAREPLEEKIDNLVMERERSEVSIEWMINTYLQQDLDQIDRNDEIWRGGRDLVLLRRNVKMSGRIDSLSRIRTCLFAVGAAHLPGDSGLVSLLRKRGFVVTAVQSSRKIAPQKYNYKTVERPWVDVDVQDSLYAIQMPGKAEPLKIFEDILPFDIRMYFDLGNMAVYMTMGVQLPGLTEANKDSMLKVIVQRFRKKSKRMREKNIVVGNQKGKEFVTRDDEYDYRFQIFAQEGFVAINALFTMRKDAEVSANANRFFQSYRPNDRNLRLLTKEKGWERYVFDRHAFSVELPIMYREKKSDESDNGWDEKAYEALDIAGNAYFGVFVGESKPGYYSNEDSTYFARAVESMEANLEGSAITSVKHFKINGFPAFESTLQTDDGNEHIDIRVFMVNRGNRKYFLLSTYDRNNPEPADRFISSFTLLPLKKSDWRKQTAPDGRFTTWAPSAVEMTVDPANETVQYMMNDSAGPVFLNVNKYVFSPYYWSANDSLLFDQRIQTFLGSDDSLIDYKRILSSSLPGVDLLIRLDGTHNLKRMRLLLNGDTLYTIFGYMPGEALETSDYQKLFTDFHINDQATSTSLFNRKPLKLLEALQSEDSIIFAMARETLAKVRFEQQDLTLLQEGLLKRYTDFDTTFLYYYSGTNSDITVEVLRLDSLHTSVAFIRDNYDKIKLEDESIKPFLLSALTRIKTAESYDLLKEIILNRPPKLNEEYYFHHDLHDSLELSRRLYPEILSRSSDPGLYGLINSIATTLLDSNLLTSNDLRPYKDLFIQRAKEALGQSSDEVESDEYRYYDLVQLLGALNLPEANALLSQLIKSEHTGLRLKAMIALFKNKQSVDRDDIRVIAASDEYRAQFYNELKDLGKVNLFPANYLSQKLLGQSEIYGLASYEDTPAYVIFLEERTEVFIGKKQKFYLYKVAYDVGDDELSVYLGVAGPYSLNTKDYTSSHDATAVVWDDEFDEKEINRLFKQHLADIEETLQTNQDDQ